MKEDMNILKQINDDLESMDFLDCLKKYYEFLNNRELDLSIQEFESNAGTMSKEELKSIFMKSIFYKYEENLRIIVDEELKENLDLVDLEGTGEALCKCSKEIFDKLPSYAKPRFIDIFTKNYVQAVNKAQEANIDIDMKKVGMKLTPEEFFEILSNCDIKQKQGESYFLDVDLPKVDRLKLLDVFERYRTTCCFRVDNCSDLDVDTIEYLQKGLDVDIVGVKFTNSDLTWYQKQAYPIHQYIACRKSIDNIVSYIDGETKDVQQDDLDREKKICGAAVRKISTIARYNYEYIEKYEKKLLTDEERISNASLISGLLNGISICSGYSEITRNVLACYDIECREVVGLNKNQKKLGHAWNKVKLDGEWYNMDVTWDADRIAAGQNTRYFLKSDEDFAKHDEYIPNRKTEKCTESVKDPEKYIRYTFRESENPSLNFQQLLKNAIVNEGVTKTEEEEYYQQIASFKENDDIQR